MGKNATFPPAKRTGGNRGVTSGLGTVGMGTQRGPGMCLLRLVDNLPLTKVILFQKLHVDLDFIRQTQVPRCPHVALQRPKWTGPSGVDNLAGRLIHEEKNVYQAPRTLRLWTPRDAYLICHQPGDPKWSGGPSARINIAHLD